VEVGKNDVQEWNTEKYNLVVNTANVFNDTYSLCGCGTVLVPIPLTARTKAWFCDSSHAGIAGSNLAGGMDVCL
jgi:hypothetical protein